MDARALARKIFTSAQTRSSGLWCPTPISSTSRLTLSSLMSLRKGSTFPPRYNSILSSTSRLTLQSSLTFRRTQSSSTLNSLTLQSSLTSRLTLNSLTLSSLTSQSSLTSRLTKARTFPASATIWKRPFRLTPRLPKPQHLPRLLGSQRPSEGS